MADQADFAWLRRRRQTRTLLLLAALYGSLVVVLEPIFGSLGAFVLISAGHTVFGLTVFVRHGGATVTATGMYFLSTAIMLGIAGIQLAITSPDSITGYTFVGSGAAFAANLALFAIRFRRQDLAPGGFEWLELDTSVRSWLLATGGSFFVGGFIAEVYDINGLGPLPDAVAYVGVVLLMAGTLGGPGGRPIVVMVRVAASAGVIALFTELFFSGFGRLVIAGLLLTALLLVNTLNPSGWHKQAIIVAIIPVLLIAGWARVSLFGGEATATEILTEGEGLGSLTNPVRYLGELIEDDQSGSAGAMPRRYGGTFVDAITASVPRNFWPDKPYGLGFELAVSLEPDNPLSGNTERTFSIAALTFGEWYVNFGWLGFLVMAPILAGALRILDDYQQRHLVGLRGDAAHVVSLLLVVVAITGIPEFVWMGSFTMIARTGLRMVLLFLLWLIVDHARHVRSTAS